MFLPHTFLYFWNVLTCMCISYSIAYVFNHNNIILGIEVGLGTPSTFSYLVMCK